MSFCSLQISPNVSIFHNPVDNRVSLYILSFASLSSFLLELYTGSSSMFVFFSLLQRKYRLLHSFPPPSSILDLRSCSLLLNTVAPSGAGLVSFREHCKISHLFIKERPHFSSTSMKAMELRKSDSMTRICQFIGIDSKLIELTLNAKQGDIFEDGFDNFLYMNAFVSMSYFQIPFFSVL